jgi:hypothetical protein
MAEENEIKLKIKCDVSNIREWDDRAGIAA